MSTFESKVLTIHFCSTITCHRQRPPTQPTDKVLFRFFRNIEDIDLESQANKLEETKQVIDHLENQVNSYHDQSEAQLKDVNALFEKTKSSGQVSYILPVILSDVLRKNMLKCFFRMLKIF